MLYSQGITKEIKYLRTELGIAYYEEGWWMLEADRLEASGGLNRPIKWNEETKQITIDYTIFTL